MESSIPPKARTLRNGLHNAGLRHIIPGMFNQKLLEECSNAHGVSGFEGEIRELVRQELSSCGESTCTAAGLQICSRKVENAVPTVSLIAHMDEVGFMVQGITPDGYLTLVPLGGWWNHTLPSQRVLVLTRSGDKIPGQIATKPPHLLPEAQRRQVMADDALFIDVGASGQAEVEQLGITPGCPVVPDVCMQPLAIPHRWMGKAFDNRNGVYCMLEAMKQLCAEQVACNLNAIGTVMEEVGTRGARAIPAEMVGDVAIILEGAPADDTPGQSSICRQGVVGKGVQVRLFDPTHITHPKLADMVLQVASEAGIPHQAAVRRTGGTDAAACYAHWQGIPTIVLSTPTRYIHSHNGIIDDRDLCACCDLVCAIVRKIAACHLNATDFVS